MATSRRKNEKAIKYGWFKDKISSKLVEFTQRLHFIYKTAMFPTLFTQISCRYICHIYDILQLCMQL